MNSSQPHSMPARRKFVLSAIGVAAALFASSASSGDAPAPGAPSALRFYAPRPNPLSRETSFAFDLPRGS